MINKIRNWLAARHRRKLRKTDIEILFPEFREAAPTVRQLRSMLAYHINRNRIWEDANEAEIPDELRGLSVPETHDLASDLAKLETGMTFLVKPPCWCCKGWGKHPGPYACIYCKGTGYSPEISPR